jgi:O-antigen ligase/polysaccharide polymerase Wzy-like membrane protein
MRWLLIALIVFLIASVVFGFDPGPAPGVKIKNGLLYLLVLGLLLRMTMDRGFRIQLPAVPMLFGIMISYALLSYVFIVLAVHYPRYDPLVAGFTLKNSLFDQLMFFLVFFYGLRTNEEALSVLKILLAAWALSHIMAVMDATGFFHVGDIQQRSDGRVQGAIGESNQYGAFVALSLPPIIAMIAMTRGISRVFWLGASVVTAATLVMTVSRGAFVATVFASMMGYWMFRRYLPTRRLILYACIGLVAAVLAGILVMALGFGDLIYERVVGQGTTGDVTTTSSGRLEIWTTVLQTMFRTPLTLLTGFGWYSYLSFPFRWVTHNHYLEQFFNLGVVGLSCSVLLLFMGVRTARRAAIYASPEVRPALISFGIGTIAIGTAVFFVNLYLPWLYYWCYAGIVMRLAANALEPQAVVASQVPVEPTPRRNRVRDPHGWTAAS